MYIMYIIYPLLLINRPPSPPKKEDIINIKEENTKTLHDNEKKKEEEHAEKHKNTNTRRVFNIGPKLCFPHWPLFFSIGPALFCSTLAQNCFFSTGPVFVVQHRASTTLLPSGPGRPLLILSASPYTLLYMSTKFHEIPKMDVKGWMDVKG